MTTIAFRAIVLSIFLIILANIPALAFSGKVVHVADGDTITVLNSDKEQIKVRLYGIDTPERKQAFGAKATNFTKKMAAGKMVEVEIKDTDRYGRTVGLVKIAGGRVLNEELVRSGFAWVYTKYCKIPSLCVPWKALEESARKSRAGLWYDKNPVPPWEWRKKK
ncbi:MAG: nuclease [Candidatus Moranbacteria bacterium]|nr:nuclease [Candidatus Moranbacteria bacterium]